MQRHAVERSGFFLIFVILTFQREGMKYKITIRTGLGSQATNFILKETIANLFSRDAANVAGTYRRFEGRSGAPHYETRVSVNDEHLSQFDVEQLVEELKTDKWIEDVFFKVYLTEERTRDTRIDARIVRGRATQLKEVVAKSMQYNPKQNIGQITRSNNPMTIN